MTTDCRRCLLGAEGETGAGERQPRCLLGVGSLESATLKRTSASQLVGKPK